MGGIWQSCLQHRNKFLPVPEETVMILEQYYIECLSHASYRIGDESPGRAVVVDPRRDVTEYLDDAQRLG
ncbi:MAG: MBL fold metallo-hydrolase, partial [Rhodococcus sp. (in: high G+C Gram-positive bacteria)]